MAILRAASAANQTLNQSSDTLLNGLTLTPASGDYFLFATVQILTDNPNESAFTYFNVYVGGTKIAHTERIYHGDTSVDDFATTYALNCKISPSGSQAVEIRYRTGVSSVWLTAQKREMTLFPMPSAGTNYEASRTTTDSTGSATWSLIVDMEITPVADDYLLVFSTSTEGASGSIAGYRVTVGGSVVAQTTRLNTQESSAAADEMPMMIACKISPNGSQAVEIEFASTTGSGTITCSERTLNLIPVDAGDIFEAKGAGDDTDSTTTDKLLDDMTITDPGADDYLVLFSVTDYIGSLGNNQGEFTYSIHEGGAVVTDSERMNEHEGSIDLAELVGICGGRITVGGATDDVEIFWQGSSTLTRTARERILVMIREAAGGTLYFQNVAGGFTPAGAIEKLALKFFSGAVAPSGAISKETSRQVAGIITPSGITAKQTQKAFAGSLTPSGILTRATTFARVLAGALTPAGTIVKDTSKQLVGVLTPAGTIVKDTSKQFTGSLTPIGALVKQAQKVFAGSLTPSSVLGRIVIFTKSIAGLVTPSGAISKETQKLTAGSVAPSGAIIKETSKQFAGSVAPSGAMAKETSKQFAGSVAPSGALVKQAQKVFAGSLTPSGILTRAALFIRAIAGVLTPTGAVTKKTLKQFAGSVAPSGALVKQTQKVLDGSLAPSGVLGRVIVFLRTLVGSFTPSGAISKETQKLTAGSVAPSGAISKETQKLVAGSVAPSGATSKETQKLVAGSVAPVGTLTASRIFSQLVGGTLTPTGALVAVYQAGGAGVQRLYRRLTTVIDGLRHRKID